MRQAIQLRFPIHPAHCEGHTLSAAGAGVNPLGLLKPNQMAIRLGTGFLDFRSPEPLGIGGLVKAKDGVVDILAVISEDEGKGNFSRFLDSLEPSSRCVTFWSMMSDSLVDILKKRGYDQVKLTDPFGKTHRCMRYGKPPVEASNDPVQPGDGGGSESTVAPGHAQGVGVAGLRPDRRPA